jgi:hypothetical protein
MALTCGSSKWRQWQWRLANGGIGKENEVEKCGIGNGESVSNKRKLNQWQLSRK